ncbi:MAG: DPP IV N-terminal domain-containing protein, partial [Gemmatimonadota bacterium]
MSSELDDGRTGLRSLVPDGLVPDTVLGARPTLAAVLLAPGLLAGLVAVVASLAAPPEAAAQPRPADFSIGEVMSAPLPSGMTASPDGATVAWVQNAGGVRNLWVASAPNWEPRRLTHYEDDDGWPIGDLAFTPDGSRLLYVRGGNPNASGWIANPTSDPEARTRDIWIVGVSAEAPAGPRKLAEGSGPAVDPSGGRVAFERDGDIWFVGLGEGAEPEAAVEDRGSAGDLAWSPDGRWLAFASGREEHSLIGLYDPAADTLDYKAPSVDSDFGPTWSPDGSRLAWVRTASEPKDLPFTPERTVAEPWSIQLFDVESGEAREVWSADEGYGSAFRGAGGGPLWWTDGGRLVFPWEESGWVHLYSVPASGGEAVPLTPGDGFVEEAALARDGRTVIYTTNQGDVDRRHLHRVPADGSAAPEPITTGEGIEWSPTPLAGGGLALMASGARDPAHAEVMPASGGGPGERRWLAPGTLPDRFPRDELVQPRQVVFPAADGMPIHGQLFLPPDVEPGEAAGRPAVIFTHGGSRRQMLLGWHYLGYYHRAYAMNQWLASKGYVVLSVNYRSGIGYGLEFREAQDYGAAGASDMASLVGALVGGALVGGGVGETARRGAGRR